MIKRKVYIVSLFLIGFQLYCQSKKDSVAVNFHLEFNKKPLELGKNYVSANRDTLSIENFKCYISNIQIHYKDQSEFTQNNSYHLIDSAIPDSFRIPITKRDRKLISKITFCVGIDSSTSNSGALSGDLDPIKGMYWAWQSGYINMKIEGKSPSCNTRKNEFQFHIGGYLQPYYAIRQLTFDVKENAGDDILVGIDLYSFLSDVNLKQTNRVMIPGSEAMELANYAAKMFYAQ